MDVVVGAAVAVVLIAVILWRQQRWRSRLEIAMTGSRRVGLSALGVSAVGSFGPNYNPVGMTYPFDGCRDTLGLVVTNGRLEIWGYVSRTPRKLYALQTAVDVRYDSKHAIPAIWIEWKDPAGRGVIGFIPIRMIWVIRRAARRKDISSLADHLRQTVNESRI